jgi:hypothetical protein
MAIGADFYLKKGDRLASLVATLKKPDGTAQDLTGATVFMYMRLRGSTGTPKINGASASIIDAANGRVQYDWEVADVDTVGRYWATFVVNISGKLKSFPTHGYITIEIEEDVA